MSKSMFRIIDLATGVSIHDLIFRPNAFKYYSDNNLKEDEIREVNVESTEKSG